MATHLWIYGKPPFRHFLHSLHLRLRKRRADLSPRIGKEFERARCRDAGINLSETSCGRIARVFVLSFSSRELRCIHRLEIGVVDINLAPDLNNLRPI